MSESTEQQFAAQIALSARRRAERPQRIEEGVAALKRLMPIAQSDTGQSRRVARFLLGLYNGTAFPFDLTDLRGLDYALHDDCIMVLRMDHSPERDVHRYFEDGGRLFTELAEQWGWLKDGELIKK